MAITYTVAECETKLKAIDAKLDELSELPTVGKVGNTTLDHSKTLKALRNNRAKWARRLNRARATCTQLDARQV